MLKPLIWGSQTPQWEGEEEEDGGEQQPQGQHGSSQDSAERGIKRERSRDRSSPATTTPSDAPLRLRRPFNLHRGASALAGPLSVNDPQLAPPNKKDRFVLSESFFSIVSPFGPSGAGNDWSVLQRDAPDHVHQVLRALMAAKDYAGAARALATLHRLHSVFDPDVYRFTVALLRLAGDHQKTSRYFRKVVGKKARSITNARVRGARAVAHDFLAYLADKQVFDEALDVSQDFLQGGTLSNHGAFKLDPSLQAHGAVLRLLAALLEHQALDSSNSLTTASADAGGGGGSGISGPNSIGASNGAGTGGQRGQQKPPPVIPGLQDPLSLIGHLRACWNECAAVTAAAPTRGSPRGRAREHLTYAKRLLEAAAVGSPDNASIAGYRAAIAAAEGGTPAGLELLARFVERNPGSVKGRRLHARLLEMGIGEARRAAGAAAGGGGGGGGRGAGTTDRRGQPRQPQREQEEESKQGAPEERESRRGQKDPEEKEEGEEGNGNDGDHGREASDAGGDGLLLAGVARARALRGWLETDPLEPRASLALARLHSEGSAAVLGVADRSLVVGSLTAQLETSHGLPLRCCLSTASNGVLHTTRAATALWAALADLLGPLRVRDEPVPVVRRGRGGTRGETATMPPPPPPPPRPGTIWDHLYGADPPWAPTDFGRIGPGGVPGLGGFCDPGTGREGVEGEEEEEGEEGGGSVVQRLGASPHPLLREVDRELWEEAVLDPEGEPLLLTGAKAGGRGGMAAAAAAAATDGDGGESWCSEDEDCTLEDEPTLLQERARLASRKTGGCLYYSPPGDGFQARGRRAESRGNPSVTAAPIPRESGARPLFETTVAGIILEGVTGTMLPGEGDGLLGEDEDDEEDAPEGGREKNGNSRKVGDGRASGPSEDSGKRRNREAEVNRDVGAEERPPTDGGAARKRPRREGVENSRAFKRSSNSSSSDGSGRRVRRNNSDGEDDDEGVEFLCVASDEAQGARKFHRRSIDGDGDTEDGEDGDAAPGLRERCAPPLGRPMGTDAAAARLSETVAVNFPQEAAVWLLADKCCVAAHLFGPQHQYCLRAIGRLCREDVRVIARPAREALRSRGFRLQLSLTRLAADNVRSEAAMEGKASVAWGLPELPSAAKNVLPLDSYLPEPIAAASSTSGSK